MSDQLQNIVEPGGTEMTTSAGGARRYRKPLKSFRFDVAFVNILWSTGVIEGLHDHKGYPHAPLFRTG